MIFHRLPYPIFGFIGISHTGTETEVLSINGEIFDRTGGHQALADNINAVYPNIASISWSGDRYITIEPGDVDVFDVVALDGYYFSNNAGSFDLDGTSLIYPPIGVTIGQARHANFLAWLHDVYENPRPDIVFPMFAAPDFYTTNKELKNPSFNGFVNFNFENTYPSDAFHRVEKSSKYPKCPLVRVVHIIDKIVEAAGMTGWKDKRYERADLENILAWTNVPIEAVSNERSVGDQIAEDLQNPRNSAFGFFVLCEAH